MCREKKQSEKKIGKDIQLLAKRLTSEEVRKVPGFEEVSEIEAEEYIDALEQFCILTYHLFTAKKEGDYEYRKAV